MISTDVIKIRRCFTKLRPTTDSQCKKNVYIVAAATVVRTTKDGRRLTVSSRMLMQRTTNNKTVESYHYDADGNLTGAEADIITWEAVSYTHLTLPTIYSV